MPRGLDVSLPEEVDPCVLDPAMVESWLMAEEGKDELEEEERRYLVDQAVTLRLEFQKIVEIDNLARMINLTRLFLDNNFIEAISGLTHLVNLEWLDLSFNKIMKIENLETLTKLKVLALFNNQIEVVENLEKLKDLEVLRLGNNRVINKRCILYLRKLTNLRTLSLKGNPVCKFKDFDGYIAAFLPNLHYYEFKLIDTKMRKLHSEKNQGEIIKVLGREQREEMKEQQRREKIETAKTEKAAFIDNLKGEDLMYTMFERHCEKEDELLKLSRVKETKDAFRTEFLLILQDLYNLGLAELKVRESEREDIEKGMSVAKGDVEYEDVELIEKFNIETEKTYSELTDMAEQLLDMDPDNITEDQINGVDTIRDAFRAKIKEMWHILMGKELMLINSIEAMIEGYERRLQAMTRGFLTEAGRLLQKARDSETRYFQRLMEQGEKWGEDGLEGVDMDNVMDVVSVCHDAHQAVLDQRQEWLNLTINTWREDHFHAVRDKEFSRSRSRVLEINQFTDHLYMELDMLEVLPDMNPEEDLE